MWEAIGWLAAVTLGVAILLMGIDYLLRLSDPGMRWLFTGLLLAAMAAAAYRWLGRRAWRGVTPLTIAQQIQADRPALGSRLASAVEFLDQKIEDPSAGSADLRRSVVTQATTEVQELPLEEVIDRGPLRRAMRVITGCLAAVALFGIADPMGLRTAAARLVAPWSDENWPRRHHLQIEDAPDRIARVKRSRRC